MLKKILSLRYEVLMFLVGFVLIVFGMFDIQDIKHLNMKQSTEPIYWMVILGITLILISLGLYISMEFFPLFSFSKVRKNKKGYSATINNTVINIIFGKIQEEYIPSSTAAIILPANEYFDDECIKDNRSVLGAFMQEKYTNRIHEVQDLVKSILVPYSSASIEKETGVFQQSYGVGACVFLDKPLSSQDKIIITAVTEKRAQKGLYAESAFIYKAVESIRNVIADNRINEIYCPILCSGHGGIKKEIALFNLIMSFYETIYKPYTHHMKTINIVIYKPNDSSKPQINKGTAKRLLNIVAEFDK